MDVLSHALWPYAVTVRKKSWRKWAALWGMLPDIGVQPQVFYLLTQGVSNPFFSHTDWENVVIPDPWMISYWVTHSAVTVGVVALVYFAWKRRWPWPLIIGWSSHILLDVFTHVGVYANRPFYPLSDFAINGQNWSSPWIFFPNWIALIVIFGILGYRRWRRRAGGGGAVAT